MFVRQSILECAPAMRAVSLVRPVFERLGLVVLTGEPPLWRTGIRPPGNAFGDPLKRGLFLWRHRVYSVKRSAGWVQLAFDMMHEAAHLIAAEGRTLDERLQAINYDDESEAVLPIEVRLWGSLGKRWTWFRNKAERDYNYELSDFQKWAFDSRETRALVERGLLTPKRETIRWENARRHIHEVRA